MLVVQPRGAFERKFSDDEWLKLEHKYEKAGTKIVAAFGSLFFISMLILFLNPPSFIVSLLAVFLLGSLLGVGAVLFFGLTLPYEKYALWRYPDEVIEVKYYAEAIELEETKDADLVKVEATKMFLKEYEVYASLPLEEQVAERPQWLDFVASYRKAVAAKPIG